MLAWGAAGRHYCQTWCANGGLWTIRTNKRGWGFSSLYYLHRCGHRRNRHRFVSPFMGFLSMASHSPAVRINAADPIRGFRSHAECQHGHHTQQEVNSGIVGLIRQTRLCELASPSISDMPDRWRRSAAGHSSEKHGGRRHGTKISNRSRLCLEERSRMCRSSLPAHLRSSHTALANGPCPEQLSLFSAETLPRSNRCNSARCGR